MGCLAQVGHLHEQTEQINRRWPAARVLAAQSPPCPMPASPGSSPTGAGESSGQDWAGSQPGGSRVATFPPPAALVHLAVVHGRRAPGGLVLVGVAMDLKKSTASEKCPQFLNPHPG